MIHRMVFRQLLRYYIIQGPLNKRLIPLIQSSIPRSSLEKSESQTEHDEKPKCNDPDEGGKKYEKDQVHPGSRVVLPAVQVNHAFKERREIGELHVYFEDEHL